MNPLAAEALCLYIVYVLPMECFAMLQRILINSVSNEKARDTPDGLCYYSHSCFATMICGMQGKFCGRGLETVIRYTS